MNRKAFVYGDCLGNITKSGPFALKDAINKCAVANRDKKGFYWIEEIRFGEWIQGQIVIDIDKEISAIKELEIQTNRRLLNLPVDFEQRRLEYQHSIVVCSDIYIQNLMTWDISKDGDFN